MTTAERIYAGLIAGTLALAVTVTQCPAQEQSIPQGVSYEALANYYGVTFCTKTGVQSYILAELPPLQDAVTRAHEAKHREQFTRFPGCTAFQHWYATPKGMLDSEAEAYMAGWCVGVSMGADGITMRQAFAELIEHNLGGVVNRLEVIQAMTRYQCRP